MALGGQSERKFAQLLTPALIFVAYFLLAKVGLSFDSENDFSSLVWPASGVGLAALLIFGKRFWPAIFFGAFAANFSEGAPFLASLAIAMGNALEALGGAWLLQKAGFDTKMERVQDGIIFVVIAVFLAPVIAPIIGVTSLFLTGVVDLGAYAPAFEAWYVGDMLGILALVPLALVWRGERKFGRKPSEHPIEFTAFIAFTVFMKAVVFLNIFDVPQHLTPVLLYPVFLPLLWGVYHFGRHGVTLVIAIMIGFALAGTMQELAPFHQQSQWIAWITILNLALYVNATAIAGLIVSIAITVQKTSDMHLRRAIEDMQSLVKAKDDFLATLAHELRNPLAPLRSYLELIRIRLPPGQPNPEADIMERQVVQMAMLLDDLLDVSRISRGKVELKRQHIDATEVAKVALQSVTPLIHEREHRVSLHIASSPVRIFADPLRIEQILVNLLNNAAKYSGKGGRIDFAVQAENGNAVVSVRDNGVGIPKESLSLIFQGFTRLKSQHGETQGGLGVGLQIVKNLVELHGGTITVKSDGPGKGSEFIVALPLDVDPATREGPVPTGRIRDRFAV